MKLKIISALILISPCVNYSFAQGKKDIKKTKMKSMTEFVTTTENGKENTYKAYYVAFNKNSEIVEETEYNNNGSIKKGETTKYDLNNNKIEETHFNPEKHEIISVEEGEENKILEEYQKGYSLYDKTVRPSKVKVGKGEKK